MEKGNLETPTATKNIGELVNDRLAAVYGITGKRTSWFVPTVMIANVFMFAAVMFVNKLSFQPLDKNGMLGPSSATLEQMGALESTKIVNQNQYWRLITCVWLHAGLMHLLVNMLSLVVGFILEWQCGFIRVGVIYILSGIGGSILSALFIPKSVSVGASGAVMGVIGASLSGLLMNWTVYSNKLRISLYLVTLFGINLFSVDLPLVNNFAHIGGFLTGFLLGCVLLVQPQSGWSKQKHLPYSDHLKSKYATHQYLLWHLATILLIVGFTVGLVMLFRGDEGNDKGSWCFYIQILGLALYGIAGLTKTWFYG